MRHTTGSVGMKFATVQLAEAVGAVLAHSVLVGRGRIPKGRVLTAADIGDLAAAGITEVSVARADKGDLGENTAASAVAAVASGAGTGAEDPMHGRVNMYATSEGLFRVAAPEVEALNRVDEAITLATLPDYTRVSRTSFVATVKIIPYFVAATRVEAACAGRAGLCSVLPFRPLRWSLILTEVAGMKPTLIEKAVRVTGARIKTLGGTLLGPVVTDHNEAALAGEIARSAGGADVVLILSGSATSDRGDVAPGAVVRAGGVVTHFGMPVDPGNLLFIGEIGDIPVVGLPGCARSPALNGADFVLERLAAGLAVADIELASMGVGGLLKDVPERGTPRRAQARKAQKEIER